MTPDIRPMLGGTSEEPTEGTSVTLTPIAKAEATLREALIKYQKWYDYYQENKGCTDVTATHLVSLYLSAINAGTWPPK